MQEWGVLTVVGTTKHHQKILGTSPANGSDDVNSKKVTILFNEFVKLDNPTEKVVVSPPQLEAPEVKVSGKRITGGFARHFKAKYYLHHRFF